MGEPTKATKCAFIIRNPEQSTIEGEIQKALFKAGFVFSEDHLAFKKLNWSRCSRTDKGVSAIMNINSTRFQAKTELSLEEMRDLINKNLPSDIEIQKIIKVSRTFSPKRHVGKREYIYLLPTFLLKPKKGKFTPGASLEEYSGDLNYRIPVELHEKVKTLWEKFEGTRRFHNYSKGIKARSSESQRKIYETSCEQLVYRGNIEFVRFKLVGMSFLYNQIRKMVGTVVEIMRENKEISYFENTFLSNKLNLPLAPGEGLYLRRLTFEGYNRKTGENGVKISADDEVKT